MLVMFDFISTKASTTNNTTIITTPTNTTTTTTNPNTNSHTHWYIIDKGKIQTLAFPAKTEVLVLLILALRPCSPVALQSCGL